MKKEIKKLQKKSLFETEDIASEDYKKKYPVLWKIGWIIFGIIILFWIIIIIFFMVPHYK